jgi:tetratricopeptide (TPR) repeat protein
MAKHASTGGTATWITELATTQEEDARQSLVEKQPHLLSAAAVNELYDAVVMLSRIDVQQAERLAKSAAWIATQINDPLASAQSARAVGHVFYLTGKHRDAIREYENALEIFKKLDRKLDVARTINGALQSLIYDGQYDRAFVLAAQAHEIFAAQGDKLRLARLDSNVANIYYRQDRFREAQELYERAYQEFLNCSVTWPCVTSA